MNNIPFGYETSDASGIAFSIGQFPIRYYGLLFTAGFFVAIVIGILKLHFFYKVSYDPFFYFVFIGVLTSIFGARFWSYVIGNNTDWSSFFNFRTGGLAVEGGVMLTTIAALIFFSLITRNSKYYVRVEDKFGVACVKKVSIWVYADAIVPLILIGQAVGRWGNFFNHEVYGAIVGVNQGAQQVQIYGRGLVSDVNFYDPGSSFLWLKTLMPGVYRGMFVYTPDNNALAFRVPLFLIESFFNVIFFTFIYGFVDQIKGYRNGTNAGLYFVYYGCVRSYLETLRAEPYYYHLSIVASICFLILGLLWVSFTQFLAPRWRHLRVWYLCWIYSLYYAKAFGYAFIKTKELSAVKPAKQNRLTWRERKSVFLTKKQNLGYNVRPNFVRPDVEMFYYYDATKMGSLYFFVKRLFKKTPKIAEEKSNN